MRSGSRMNRVTCKESVITHSRELFTFARRAMAALIRRDQLFSLEIKYQDRIRLVPLESISTSQRRTQLGAQAQHGSSYQED